MTRDIFKDPFTNDVTQGDILATPTPIIPYHMISGQTLYHCINNFC